MDSLQRTHIFVGLLVCCLCLGVVGTAVADSEYDLRAENAIDTPEQTVSFDGTEFTIDHIGVVDDGDETIDATVTAPEESHNVELRNADREIIEIQDEQSDGTVSFSVGDNQLDAGTYMVLLFDGTYERAVPVVVSGYDLNVELTESADGEELTVRSTVTPTEGDEQPTAVEVVVWNEDTQERETLNQQSETDYETTVSLSAFEDTEYDVYVVATGDKTLYNDENEILAISEPSVDEADSGSDDDGGASDPVDDDPNEVDDTDDADDADNDDTAESEPSENESTVDDSEPTNDPADDSSVIRPNDPNEETSDDENESSVVQADDDTPLSPIVAVVGLLLTVVVVRWRFGHSDS